jgi:6-pyruvoyltetrahydropterin/6-carboxytetrahydropterin synthase
VSRSVTLIRSIRFPATHHYHRREWDEARNREAFGPTADPHDHDYELTVEVAGEPDADTGFVTDLTELDALLEGLVSPLRGADLNRVIPEVAEGRAQPSTEFLAMWIWDRIAPALPSSVRLRAVRVAESPDLAGEVRDHG